MKKARQSGGTASKNGEDASAEKRQPVELGRPIGQYLLWLFMVISGLAAMIWVVDAQLSSYRLNVSRTAMSNTLSRAVAGRVSEQLRMRQHDLSALARDPKLVKLAGEKDSTALDAYVQKITGSVANDWIWRARVLPPNWDTPNPNAHPPFGYVALEEIRSVASSGQTSDFELVKAPDDSMTHVSVALPVKTTGGQLVAVMQVALKPDWLLNPLRQVPETTAVGLLQRAQGKLVQMSANVSDVDFTDQEESTVSVTGSTWLIASRNRADGPAWLGLVHWGLLGLLLVLSFGAVWIVQRRLHHDIEQDQDDLVQNIRAIREGQKPLLGQARIREFHQISKLIQGLKAQPPEPKPKPEARRPMPSMPAEAVSFPGSPEQPKATAVSAPAEPEHSIELVDDKPKVSKLSQEIFHPDGIFGQESEGLDETAYYYLGRAFGSEMMQQGETSVVVGWDARPSSETFSEALIKGLTSAGITVSDLGKVPTPVLYYFSQTQGPSNAAMVTGSHLSVEHNGLKLQLAGEPLHGKRLLRLLQRIQRQEFVSGQGSRQQHFPVSAYQQQATIEINLHRSLRLVVDCGHGVTGLVAPELFRSLGCDLLELRTDIDESAEPCSLDPGRHGQLHELSAMVQAGQADLGLAFDADGVRLGVVDSRGRQVAPDQCLMLLARDILSRNPGVDILFDEVKSSTLVPVILEQGGLPVKWKAEQGPMRSKMMENQALLGGETDGRYYIAEHWFGFDDAIYAAVRLLELVSLDSQSSAEMFDGLS